MGQTAWLVEGDGPKLCPNSLDGKAPLATGEVEEEEEEEEVPDLGEDVDEASKNKAN